MGGREKRLWSDIQVAKIQSHWRGLLSKYDKGLTSLGDTLELALATPSLHSAGDGSSGIQSDATGTWRSNMC